MNKKGFAISIILYSMVFLLVTIFYILLGIVKSRYTVMNNLRNNIIEDFNESSLLADKILKLCYDPGIDYVKKYNVSVNGSAIDTPDGSGNEDVCYYTSINDNNLAGKNGNVIFGDYCWQIVRTTADGGVKVVYNGPKTSDDKCPNDNSKRTALLGVIGEGGNNVTNISGSKTYGDRYTIINDNGTSKFKLKNASTLSWNDSTYQNIIGKYVCGNASEPTGSSSTCEYLYYIGSYYSSTEAFTEKYSIGANSHFSQIGTASFNASSDSVSLIGYMFGNTYNSKAKDFSTVIDIIKRNKVSVPYYYGDTATWNSSTNKYDLLVSGVAPTSTQEWTSIRSSAMGKYTCLSGEYTSCETVYYIAANSKNAYMYSVPLSNNEKIEDKKVTWTYSTSYTTNGSNYTLSNPTTEVIELKNWVKDNTKYQNIYLCSDYSSSTCSELFYIYITSQSEMAYNKSSNNFSFGNSVTYSGGNYTINTDSDPNKYHVVWDWYKNFNNIGKSHYTCFISNTDTCGSSVYYVYYTDPTTAYYIELKDGELIGDALNKMINQNNESTNLINRYNSSVKGIIDSWYEQNLSPYAHYLDTYAVFCNDRTVTNVGGWSPTGDAAPLNFQYSSLPTSSSRASLKCPNDSDRLSQKNTEVAKLNYPIGLLTGAEISMMNSPYTKTGKVYWTMSPASFTSNSSVRFVYPQDATVSLNVHTAYGIRPVIVLNHDLQVTGKGTYDKPYIVETTPQTPLTITALDQTITYGDNIVNTINEILAGELMEGDRVVSVTLTPSTLENTNSGTITPSEVVIKDMEDNDVTYRYSISYVPGNLVVSQHACNPPTNISIGTDGKVTWTASSNCSGATYKVCVSTGSASCDPDKTFTSGSIYSDITAAAGTRNVHVMTIAPNSNYSNSSVVKASKAVYTVSLTAGTGTSNVTGAGRYISGASVTINASVNSGYTWYRWVKTSDGSQVSTSKSYTASITSNWDYKSTTMRSYSIQCECWDGKYWHDMQACEESADYNICDNGKDWCVSRCSKQHGVDSNRKSYVVTNGCKAGTASIGCQWMYPKYYQ